MSEDELIKKLSMQYGIPEDRLSEYISLNRETIGLEDAEGNINIFQKEGNQLKTDTTFSKRRSRSFGEVGIHFPIYGDQIVRVSTENSFRDYKIEVFLKHFGSLILFLVPLYGAFEYSDRTKELQASLKNFALDFGTHVGKQVMVFDFWTEEHFDYTQYRNQQKGIMDQFAISEKDLPALLVSNRSPFSWAASHKYGKCVILSFKNFELSELGSKLREISSSLKNLQLPSKWGHDWSRFRGWCKSNGIVGKLIRAGLGKIKI